MSASMTPYKLLNTWPNFHCSICVSACPAAQLMAKPGAFLLHWLMPLLIGPLPGIERCYSSPTVRRHDPVKLWPISTKIIYDYWWLMETRVKKEDRIQKLIFQWTFLWRKNALFELFRIANVGLQLAALSIDRQTDRYFKCYFRTTKRYFRTRNNGQ